MKREADEQRLAEFRGLREEAWRIVKDDLARLQSDIADRGIAERIKDRVGEEAREVWDATRDVATEHKGVSPRRSPCWSPGCCGARSAT